MLDSNLEIGVTNEDNILSENGLIKEDANGENSIMDNGNVSDLLHNLANTSWLLLVNKRLA